MYFPSPPSRYFTRKFSLFLVKNVLSTHMKYSEADHSKYSAFKGSCSLPSTATVKLEKWGAMPLFAPNSNSYCKTRKLGACQLAIT